MASRDDVTIFRPLCGEEVDIECGVDADGGMAAKHAIKHVEAIEVAALREIRCYAPEALRGILAASKPLFILWLRPDVLPILSCIITLMPVAVTPRTKAAKDFAK